MILLVLSLGLLFMFVLYVLVKGAAFIIAFGDLIIFCLIIGVFIKYAIDKEDKK